MTKRILAMLMVVAMVLSVLPAGVFAEYAPLEAHDDAKHICEHCDAAATWTAWGGDDAEKTKLPGSSGHYYLVNDIKMSTQAAYSSADVVICLNGHDIIGNNSGYNIFRMDGTAKVTIVDCTAKTENGVYTAGKITAYSGKIAVMMVSSNTGAIFTMYDGIITGCKGASGCAANIQGKGTMNVFGGEISNNTGGGSGTIYVAGNDTALNIENAVIKDNTATGNGGVVNLTGGKVTIKNSQVTGNVAAAGGVVYMKNGTLTLDGATVTGNRTSSTYGAIYAFNDGGTASIVLKGETVVTGNTFGDETSKTERNIYMRDHWYTVNPVGLTGNAKIGLFVETSRINQTNGKQYLTGALNGFDPLPFFTSDKEEYIPGLAANGRLILVVKPEHLHKVCCDAACQDGHADVSFTRWGDDDAEKTKLPTSGAYYLVSDIDLQSATNVTGELTLCLNGHNIVASKNVNVFRTSGSGKVTITDCTAKTVEENGEQVYKAGKITPFNGGYTIMMATDKSNGVEVPSNAVFNLYAGIITGATTNSGSVVNMKSNTVFNMYGGEIANNVGGGSGTIYMAGNAKFNALGGTIRNNKAGSGGVFNLAAAGTVLTVDGATVTGNTATSYGGAVMAANGSKVNIVSGKITNNSAPSGGALYMSKKTTLTMTGGEISGNTSTGSGAAVYHLESTGNYNGGTITGNVSDYNGGGIFSNGSTLNLGGVKITDNQAAGGAGVYVNEASAVTLSGDTQITGNTANGKRNNLYLPGNVVVKLGALGDNAKIGLSVATAFRFVSEQSDTDYSARFDCDRASLMVEYKDKKLYLGASGNHAHCLCDAAIKNGCDHTDLVFAAWDDPNSLPSSGNWCLTTNVTLTAPVDIQDKTLSLCLNGHTIQMKSQQKATIFNVKRAAVLNITDCTDAPGKLTGATNSAIFGNTNATGSINLYNGIITGNSGDNAGAVMLQTDLVFNMYGGKVTDNTHAAALVLDANGEPALDADGNQKFTGATGGGAVTVYYGNTQFNMYGGEISGNKSTAVTYKKGGVDTKAGGDAGAIYGEGNSMQINLYGGTISNNAADTAGGAVAANRGTINLKGTKITGNTASGKAGAVYATGAAKVNLDGSELISNKAPNGGAVLIESGTVLEFTSGKVAKNTATDGAGIYMTTRTTFNMVGGEISGNVATGNGGGLALLRCEATISGGKITGNTAKYGGGILVRGCELQLKGGEITKNTATNNGGGIKTGNQETADMSYTAKIVMTDGLISENTANYGGGAIVEGAGCEMLLKGGKITKNTAKTDGGGFYVSTKTVFNMEGGEISGNSAKRGGGINMLKSTGTFTGGEISGNQCSSTGGGVYVTNEPATATFDGTTVKNNKGGYGGGICIANRAKLDVKSGKFSNNTAVNNGGGMYISTNCTLNMYGGSITSNTVEKDTGGGLYGLRSTMNLYGGTVSYNSSKVGGGGIMAAGATLNLKGTDVLYNTAISASGAGGTGGGVRTNCQTVTQNGVKTQYNAKIVMTAGTIKGNEAGYAGGGVLVNGIGASMEMSGGVISDNATTLGGGLYVSNGTTLTVTGGEFSRNEATGEGGAFWFAKNTVHSISKANISENISGKNGGAVYLHNNAECTFTDVTFNKNIAQKCGGAIFTVQDSNPIMIRCTFTENESIELSGGAVFARYMATAEDCVFTGNKSGAHAGALYCGQSSLAVNGFGIHTRDQVGIFISGCTFENNVAPNSGGAMYVIMSGFTEMKDSVFTGNTAGETGSAIWAEEDMTMTNVTVTDNIATNGGYAVYLANSEFDGESYFKGLMLMEGDMIIKDNQGGDLYLGAKTTVSATVNGFGQNTHMNVTLDSGYLTQRIYGSYNYEGGDCVYTLTYGDRSLTEPENPAEPVVEEEAALSGDTWLYVGIGVFAVAVIAVAVLLLCKKKKTAQEAEKK